MKHAKERKDKGKLIAGVIAAVLFVTVASLAALWGFGFGPSSKNGNETSAESANFDLLNGTDVRQEVSGDTVLVETSQMTLEYPSEFAGIIRAEESAHDIGSTVVFYGTIGEREVALYAIHFGGEAGEPVGVLNMDEGYAMDVTAEFSNFIPGDDWSANDADSYGSMQETLNYVIRSMAKNSNFETV